MGAPTHWKVPDLPEGVRVHRARAGSLPPTADAVVVAFVPSAARLRAIVDLLARQLAPTATLWIAWPRRAGGHESDVTDWVVRDLVVATGLVDVKVAALDDDWSGLRFVWRQPRADKEG